MPSGFLFALVAFLAWGLFPAYFRQIGQVPALEVVAHRVVWAWVVVAAALGWIGWRNGTGVADLLRTARRPRVLAVFAASALLVSINWLIYVWAVEHGRVLDASLGYFINPLVNVLLGFALLHERPRPVQWVAIALAGAGVAWLAWNAGHAPIVALALAASFGGYGMVRKIAPLGALDGLAVETTLLLPFAAGLLVLLTAHGSGGLVQRDAATLVWLLLAGPITAVPLLLFAAAARRMPLTTLGVLQYVTPTGQFLLGVWLFDEPLPPARLVGFTIIWTALGLYVAEMFWQQRRTVARAALAAQGTRAPGAATC